MAEKEKAIVNEEEVENVMPRPGSRRTGSIRTSTWTAEEDSLLTKLVKQYCPGKKWKAIAAYFANRTNIQCLHRWHKVLNPVLIKGPWLKEEDEKLIGLVHKHGPKNWSAISKSMQIRTGKQCRERWYNHLTPSVNKDPWTKEEESTLVKYHQIYGNKWAEIAKFMPGRTDNSIKNYWHCKLKKKMPASGFHTNNNHRLEEDDDNLNGTSRREIIFDKRKPPLPPPPPHHYHPHSSSSPSSPAPLLCSSSVPDLNKLQSPPSDCSSTDAIKHSNSTSNLDHRLRLLATTFNNIPNIIRSRRTTTRANNTNGTNNSSSSNNVSCSTKNLSFANLEEDSSGDREE
ncbi:transcription factor MYB3R-1-like [Humulus lupulus]|uniref:transcription factor MYB3R-1-like n=1 Tax=Humulus lupulus TaxID=3486 RepID=UPI002B40B13E|nr:transcription factor MYB3R-1-like [Humulus lupulus]